MLTRRQYEVAKMLAEMNSTRKEIAVKFNVSVRTVSWYTETIYRKLGVRNRIALVRLWSANEYRLSDWFAYVRWANGREQ